jgi:ATP-binding cassette subfamily F protein 3
VEATADRLWIVKNGTVATYDGDMDSYRSELLAERGGKSRSRTEGAAGDARSDRAGQRRASAERRAELAPLKKAAEAAERQVTRLSTEIAQHDSVLADPQLYERDAARAQQIAIARGQLAKQLAAAEDAWLSATDAYEQAAADADPSTA